MSGADAVKGASFLVAAMLVLCAAAALADPMYSVPTSGAAPVNIGQ
jgi:hypothetical protein